MAKMKKSDRFIYFKITEIKNFVFQINMQTSPDDSKYEIEVSEANLTAQEQADARIGIIIQ